MCVRARHTKSSGSEQNKKLNCRKYLHFRCYGCCCCCWAVLAIPNPDQDKQIPSLFIFSLSFSLSPRERERERARMFVPAIMNIRIVQITLINIYMLERTTNTYNSRWRAVYIHIAFRHVTQKKNWAIDWVLREKLGFASEFGVGQCVAFSL